MKVADILKWENTKIVCCENSLNNQITDGYVSDLLSDVMANANENMAWITIQTHKNLVAIASLKELSCIIITNNNTPADDLIEAAKQENIPIISTSMSSFDTAGKLYVALHFNDDV
ncbi:MAG TPA: DRTGG domain-containing protein [Bacteroidales bacterium]|jgi:predicted transcriptional regulator|nr:DRTGG domain-containing protein [Bacteroidales bacterium]HOB77326.1 DRTGG domain-containing protein [Bacteroidales bacterium]HPZ60666.1 DRTGG domain-containing protein [Bacteroidales bacterium]HQD58166.1 DRTGG domain-containing protein [Bacteroidales bacterium]